MGITPGALVEVERVAPLGDPIDIKVKGYHLSLRLEEAKSITVELH
ncbi:MAG: FeoA domain-containing protein [Deltaproteobacteria bacterium]